MSSNPYESPDYDDRRPSDCPCIEALMFFHGMCIGGLMTSVIYTAAYYIDLFVRK